MILCNYPGCRTTADSHLALARHHLADHDGRVRGPEAQCAAVADLLASHHGRGMTAVEVAASLGLSSGRARDLLGALERAGTVQRVADSWPSKWR